MKNPWATLPSTMAACAIVDVRRPLKSMAAAESTTAPRLDAAGRTVMHITVSRFEFTTEVGAHLAPSPQCSCEDSFRLHDVALSTRTPLIASRRPT
jgi:hypothetical protein